MRDLWNDLQGLLGVVTEIEADETSDAALPVKLKFTVTNMADMSPRSPEIVFEEVTLTIAIESQTRTVKLGDLAGKQSTTYEHRCRYLDLCGITAEVHAKVSPTAFFTFHNAISTGGSNTLPLVAWIQVLNETGIHRWLESTIKPLLVPGPQTTLAEIDAAKESLGKAISDIREAQGRLQTMWGLVRPTGNQDKLIQYRKTVDHYLETTERECGQLRESLSSRDARAVSSHKSRATDRLEEEARRLDKETSELETAFGIPNQLAASIHWPLRSPE